MDKDIQYVFEYNELSDAMEILYHLELMGDYGVNEEKLKEMCVRAKNVRRDLIDILDYQDKGAI